MAGVIQLNSITMATESSGSITAELDTIKPNTNNGSLTLQGDSSGSGVTGITIDSSGNAQLAGNLIISTAGKGIDFSNATDSGTGETATGSVLSDYEDGTFLPTLGDGTNFHTLHSSEKGGVYIKVGNLVTCYGITKISTINTSVTTHNIYLPFTCYSYSGSIIANVAGTIVSRYVNYPQDYLTCYITEGTNYLQIVSPKSGGTFNPISFDDTAIAATNAWFIFSITYRVA